MPRLVILGSAAAVPDAAHENTYMVLDGDHGAILIDCAGSPIGRLERAGVSLSSLRSIIITHIHPDHAYGLPILLMSLWLLGRREPLRIYAPAMVIGRLHTIMAAYEWGDWPHFYPVDFVEILPYDEAPVLDDEDFLITALPCDHFVPTVSLKIVSKSSGHKLVYTSDTAPLDSLTEFARGADLLLHEAAGATRGHSSAGMAGHTAREANARKLVLIHYQVYADPAILISEARLEFGGPIEVAQDFSEHPL